MYTYLVFILLFMQTCAMYKEDILKGSLTFVIDDTGSMWDEISQVKESVNFIFDTVTNSKDSQIENFVLVTFNDPDTHLLTITKDRNEFKRALSDIQVDGGGDCPEYAMSGIKLALQSSLPQSLIYVYTDASAYDFGMLEEVRSLAQKNQVQVSFLLTGQCGERTDPDYEAYYNLANATYGDVYNMMKTDVKDIMNFIGEKIKGRDTVLAAGTFSPGYGHRITFTLDSAMGDVFISASGEKPSVELLDSMNRTVVITDVVAKNEIAIKKVVEPKPGVYTAVVGSGTFTVWRVRAKTTISIEARFSGFKPTSPEDTVASPAPEGNTFLSIIMHGDGVKLKNATVFDMSRAIVATLPLRLVDEKTKFYVADAFNPPKTFLVSVLGYDEDGAPVKRDITTPIERQNIKFVTAEDVAPTVTINGVPEISTDFDAPVRLICNVHGYPKPKIIWREKDTGITLPSEVTIKDIPYDYISVLNIEKMKKNATYECKATNKIGEKSDVIKVSMKTYFNIIETPKELLHLVYGEEAKIVCKVDANPPANVQWFKDAKPLAYNSNVQLSSDMTTVTIKHVEIESQGIYMCEVKNDLKRKIFQSKLDVYGLKPPKIEESFKELYVSKGDYSKIECRITAGVPPPTRRWYRQQKGSEAFEVLHETNEILHLNDITRDDIGTYKCIASNAVGSVQYAVDLFLNSPPTIVKDKEEFKLVEDGDEVIIPCDVDGVPKPNVTWSHGEIELVNGSNILIMTNQSLKILKAKVSDIGNYYCIATNEFGVAEKKAYVDVFVAPNILIPRITTFSIMVGRSLLLPCEADGYPRPEIKWVHSDFHNTSTKNLRSGMSSTSLVLRKAQLRDEGYYTCTASNVGGETKLTFTVEVNAPPIIENTYTSKTFRAVKGDVALRIHCKVTGRPEPTIVWKKNGLNIASGTDWYDVDTNGTLIIKNIDEESKGSYLCFAENKIGHDSMLYNVVVDDFPMPGITLPEKLLEEGQTAKIACDIPHTILDSIRWYKSRRLIATGELTLSSVTPGDEGIYSCRVSNMFKSMSKSVRVKVGYKPRFVTEEETVVNFVRGDSVPLICEAQGQPDPKVTWYFNNKIIDENAMTYDLNMHVDNKGTYTCEVKNDLGSVSRTFTLVSKDCLLNTKKDFVTTNQPFMVTPSLTWPTFDVINNFMLINKDEVFYLSCPKGFSKFPAKKYIVAFCEGETKVKISGNIYEFSDIKCNEETEVTVRESGKSCLSRGATEMVEVGYTLSGRFLKAFDVCVDKLNYLPLYTQHNLSASAYNASKNSNKWSQPRSLSLGFDSIYDCNNQAYELSSVLGKDFHRDDGCCFGKRQLVNPQDLRPGMPTAVAFSYLNVVPHWSTCNSKNWEDVEDRVRKLAKSFRLDLKISTGTAKPLRIRGLTRYSKDIELHDDRGQSQPVAKYLWKVIQEQETSRGLAIIQINVPDLKPAEAPSHVLCRDICHEIKWMRGIDWHNTANGYIYCCSIQEFESRFNFYRQFSSGRVGILRDVFYSPRHE